MTALDRRRHDPTTAAPERNILRRPELVVAVDHAAAALAVGLSPSRLRHHVRLGDVTPHFSGTKPIYLVTELQRFAEHLPTRPEHLPPT